MDNFANANNNDYSPADLELNVPAHNNETEEESDDSDKRRLFDLPKRKIRRPPSQAFKRKIGSESLCFATAKSCFKVCGSTLLPILIAVFIVSSSLCMVFLLVAIAGMKQELNLLKIKTNNVAESEKVSISRTSELRSEYDEKLTSVKSYESYIQSMQKKITLLQNEVSSLNTSIFEMQSSPTFHVLNRIEKVSRDIDSIKSGMADTGADIGKLEHSKEEFQNEIKQLASENMKFKDQLFNMTVLISMIEDKPIPSATTTPKTLVVTLTPDEDLPITRKEAKGLIADLEAKQKLVLTNSTVLYSKELNDLRDMITNMNSSYAKEILDMKSSYQALWNKTNTNNNKTMKPINLTTLVPIVKDATTTTTATDLQMSKGNKTFIVKDNTEFNTTEESPVAASTTTIDNDVGINSNVTLPTTVPISTTTEKTVDKLSEEIRATTTTMLTIRETTTTISTEDGSVISPTIPHKPIPSMQSTTTTIDKQPTDTTTTTANIVYPTSYPATDPKSDDDVAPHEKRQQSDGDVASQEKRSSSEDTMAPVDQPSKEDLSNPEERSNSEDMSSPFDEADDTSESSDELVNKGFAENVDKLSLNDLKDLDPETLKLLVRRLKKVNAERNTKRRSDDEYEREERGGFRDEYNPYYNDES